MIAKIFEEQGKAVAMIGSLGSKIKNQSWPNTLKMTMPGRFKLQKFLYEAKRAGCEYVVMEATSEGIAQHRLKGISVDCAVITNIHREHIESHGSFENYINAKKKLFWHTRNIHIINADDKITNEFKKIPAQRTLFFRNEDMTLQLAGSFNISNASAALAVTRAYGLDEQKALRTLTDIVEVPGRMQYVQREPFAVVVDYAHTPDSLEAVYKTLKNQNKLICVLGACGGGRDVWKRPVFGEIADRYCDEVILTNEDPYDEDPEKIISDIKSKKAVVVIDRKEAIIRAIHDATPHDTVIITGKGSETSMALAGGKQIPWSDFEIASGALRK